MTRYILCRPEGGLNDTLTQIENAFLYGQKTNRVIVVDTNHVSSKHFRDDFGQYFTSLDPNLHLSVNEFKDVFDSVKVYPYFLNGRVSNYDIENSELQRCWIETKFKLPIYIDYDLDYTETLLVHQHFGGGLISIDALKKMKLNGWLVDELINRLTQINGPYHAIHIRNTDIRTDYNLVIQKLSELNIEKLFVATDSNIVLNSFKQAFGNRIITFTELPEDEQPLHYLNTSSRQRNTDAIMDLLTLACSDVLYAAQLHNCNFANFSGFTMLATQLWNNKAVLQSLIGDDRIKFNT